MAISICCPCGRPLDCDNLDLIVTLTCPRCRQELSVELGENAAQRKLALLTIMDGPHWIGEQFVVPIDVDLSIGKASGNWLALDGEGVADRHCALRLFSSGALVVEDRKSPTGTWVGNQRIAKGRLAPRQSFRVGPFRLRLDYQSSDGTTVAAATVAVADASGLLPTMVSVTTRKTPLQGFLKHRYRIVRAMLLTFALVVGLLHVLGLHGKAVDPWPWHKATIAGLLVAGGVLMSSRRVALAHRQLKFVSLGVLVLLAILDLLWALPAISIGALGLAACVSVLCLVENPSAAFATFAAATGSLSVILVFVKLLRDLFALGGA
jgi:hypothetical protein